MTITYLPIFLKHYKKRIANNLSLKKRFKERVELFTENKNNPVLRNHALSGDLEGFYAFSITGDIRVVYKFEIETVVLFYDIGTHNQVYK
jgi:addiction module RelE/StbE family toxin